MPKKKKDEGVAEATSQEPVETAATEAPAEPSPIVRKHTRLDKLLAGELMGKIAKKHGVSIIRRASEHHASISQMISTGVFSLDYALGGGFRVGGIHTVWGPKSSGKTTTLLKTIATAQCMCANCWTFAFPCDPLTGEVYTGGPKCQCGKYREVVAGYINNEGTWDQNWARALGVDTDALLLSEPEFAEQSLDIGEALLRSNELDILAIDSIAFMTPKEEIEKSNVDLQMGAQAKVMGKGVRKFVSALNWAGNRTDRKPTVFFTNQVRFKIGMVFGNPEMQPGGQAPQFAATTETKFKSGKLDIEKDEGKGEDKKDQTINLSIATPMSVDFSFRIEKNKQGAPMREGAYRLLLASTEEKKKGDVADEPVIIEQAEKFGIIEKSGGKWLCAGQPFDTKKAIEKAVTSNLDFRKALSQAVLKILLAD